MASSSGLLDLSLTPYLAGTQSLTGGPGGQFLSNQQQIGAVQRYLEDWEAVNQQREGLVRNAQRLEGLDNTADLIVGTKDRSPNAGINTEVLLRQMMPEAFGEVGPGMQQLLGREAVGMANRDQSQNLSDIGSYLSNAADAGQVYPQGIDDPFSMLEGELASVFGMTPQQSADIASGGSDGGGLDITLQGHSPGAGVYKIDGPAALLDEALSQQDLLESRAPNAPTGANVGGSPAVGGSPKQNQTLREAVFERMGEGGVIVDASDIRFDADGNALVDVTLRDGRRVRITVDPNGVIQ